MQCIVQCKITNIWNLLSDILQLLFGNFLLILYFLLLIFSYESHVYVYIYICTYVIEKILFNLVFVRYKII